MKPLLLALCVLAPSAFATWVPTADSTTSAPKFTDGNFVIKWNTNNKQLSYVSHDSTVSTVLDMTTFSEDVDAVSGYSHPTAIAEKGFQSKSGITRVVLPEACTTLYLQALSSLPDLETVVISSRATFPGKQVFSSNKKLSTITPRGVTETNGVVFFPSTVTAIPSNVFQGANGTGIRHVIAPFATDFGGDACFTGCNGLETVTVKDLKHIYQMTFQNCYALTNITVLTRDNPLSGIESFPNGGQQFQSCSSWTQPFDFSAATFTSLPQQMFYGAERVPEFRLPATLASFNKQALRCESYKLSVPRRIWFYGAPPSYMYWKSGDPDYLWWGPTSVRQVVFVPEAHAAAWKTALSNHGTWTDITDTDRARADYPTKLTDVKAKVTGRRFDLVPTKVKDSDVLGLSTEGSVGRPYYVVQWREIPAATVFMVR